MSYCVNCGVELHAGVKHCPLCGTPVYNPNELRRDESAPFFAPEKEVVPPASRREAALLLSAMLCSVAVCCGVLNLFLNQQRPWSLYVIGAAVMLWIWFVPPLLARGMHLLLRLLLDVAAVAIYVFLISVDLDGRSWFCGLALPIILWGGAILLLLGLVLRVYRRSVLTSVTILIGSVGVLLFGVEFFLDRWLSGSWEPSWSVVVLAVCAGLTIPLLVIRRVPSLREEVRRRFHL